MKKKILALVMAAAMTLGLTACGGGAPSVVVMVSANSRFPKRQPEFTEFLKKYHTSSALTAEALAYIADNKATYDQAARWFLQKHDNLLTQWLPPDKAQTMRAALKEQ